MTRAVTVTCGSTTVNDPGPTLASNPPKGTVSVRSRTSTVVPSCATVVAVTVQTPVSELPFEELNALDHAIAASADSGTENVTVPASGDPAAVIAPAVSPPPNCSDPVMFRRLSGRKRQVLVPAIPCPAKTLTQDVRSASFVAGSES